MKLINKITLLVAFFSAYSVSVMAEDNTSFSYSSDTIVSQEQKEVHKAIVTYQTALNSGDTSKILTLFSKESYSQWNDKLTADTDQKRKEQYDSLLSNEKFETDFVFDTIWINDNVAVVRTHHHKGSVVTDIKENKTVIDLNREVFIMHKENGKWMIYLYTFNTNPLQGVS